MPLSQRVTFQTPVHKRNRLQIPSIIRWQFKLETTEILQVSVALTSPSGLRQKFYAKMRKDGCITIPQATLALLSRYKPIVENELVEVTLETA